MGGLAYFAEFLESTRMFEKLVAQCPLSYESNNAPSKREVLGTILLSALQGHTRYAHMASLAGSQLDAQTLGMSKIPSEDSIRAALGKLAANTEPTQRWLEACFDRLGAGCLEVPWVLDIDVTDLEREASQVRGLYNPRGDNENCYDELKNHWGWGGFTLRDLARSELMANLVALIYNLWSVYIKLVDPLANQVADFGWVQLLHDLFLKN
jgi:hypothetical protein